MSLAHPTATGWAVCAPEPVGALDTLFARLRQQVPRGAVALGVDFPLGLPRDFVARHAAHSAENFPQFLRALHARAKFWQVAATLADIGPHRPFYPARSQAGLTRAAHATALGLANANALFRACDRATAQRPAGAPLFWTLGANQTGKAAISAWRDLLCPALQAGDAIALWPFAGNLRGLLRPGTIAIAETYPAEALRQAGLVLSGSKRRQPDRAMLAAPILAALAARGAAPSPALAGMIADGFGADATAEDRFDSLIGLLSVLGVLVGHRPDSAPDDRWIQNWEGWVLGQIDAPKTMSHRI